MSTDLEVREVVHPATGEVVALDAPAGDLARMLDDLREFEWSARQAKRLISQAVLARMDPAGSWTIRDGGYELKGDGPGRVEYDGDKLAAALVDLVQAGRITAEAAGRACNQVVTFKPKAAGINALRKLGGDVAAAIDECAEPVDPSKRRVSVKRAA